jgi:hypothetical protein
MEDILANLAKDTAPKNFDEFYLGMVLLGLYEELMRDEDDFDPVAYDNMLDRAPEVLATWEKKYNEEYNIAVGKASESTGNGE